jgi:hypothetical protein
MDYTDVYFTLDGIALAGLLIAMALACYLAHRRYRRKTGSPPKRSRRHLRQRKV